MNRKSSPTSHNKRSPYARLDMETEKKNESPIKEEQYLKQRRYYDKEKKNAEEKTGFFKIP